MRAVARVIALFVAVLVAGVLLWYVWLVLWGAK